MFIDTLTINTVSWFVASFYILWRIIKLFRPILGHYSLLLRINFFISTRASRLLPVSFIISRCWYSGLFCFKPFTHNKKSLSTMTPLWWSFIVSSMTSLPFIDNITSLLWTSFLSSKLVWICGVFDPLCLTVILF